MTEDREQDWPSILADATAALRRELGTSVAIADPAPVIDGWTARHVDHPHVRRCVVSGLSGRTSVIVKAWRPARDARAGAAIAREWVALALLGELDANIAARVLAHGEDFVVVEDLGRGPAVEDALVGDDPASATDALVALARCLGVMQGKSHGHEAAFRDRLAAAGIDTHADCLTVAGWTVPRRWAALREIAASAPALPDARDADADIDQLTAQLADPGPLLALSSGDFTPQNCRLVDGEARLFDFEEASYRHVMLDVANLRLPFCAAACWARLPVDVTEAMEAGLRAELGRRCPAILDAQTYATGMAVATGAWAVTRLVRLPKLLARDEPHPMGFSRRGQLLDTIQCAIAAAAAAGILTGLRAWLEQTAHALRRVWAELPSEQRLYPAFRTDGRRRA